MAVSPTVNSYQMQGQSQTTTSAEQIFHNKFTDAAFTTLRAKFPQLASLVVTFKVVEADVDTGAGLGAFVLRTAGDVAYVPVVMSGGAITSCEMLYDKGSNSFMPLLPKVVQDIVNTNKIETASLLAKPPKVEDSRNLFRNMIRPPHSSNAILASSGKGTALAALPNEAKAKVTEYLEKTPALLAKIAEFYPVEVLASKLAKVAEEVLPAVDFPDVVSIDSLKEDTLKALTQEEKEALLRDGYAVRNAAPSKSIEVYPVNDLSTHIEKEFELTEVSSIPGQAGTLKTGYVFSTIDGGIRLKKALIISPTEVLLDGKKSLYSSDGGCSPCSGNVREIVRPDSIIASQVKTATSGDILGFGFVPVSRAHDSKEGRALIVYPVKSGGYKVFHRRIYGGVEVNKTDNSVSVSSKYGPSFIFTKDMNYGVVDDASSSSQIILPYDSLIFITNSSEYFLPVIKNMGTVLKYLKAYGRNLKVIDDGTQILINDTKSSSTKTLSKKAEAAKYLVEQYGLGAEGVTAAFEAKDVLVLDKTAFLTQQAIPEQAVTNQGQVAPFMQQQPGFQPQMIDDFAELGDQEMLDTGILASFAQDADIKENFVDLLPSFSEALTSVGRTILLCSVRKQDLEGFYGREKYQTFVASCKRVFKTLGEIVVGLKEYINMNQ